MAREAGIYRRGDSPFWWIDVALPNGRRVRQSSGTGDRKEAEALVVKLKHDAHREAFFGVKPKRTWQEAVVRYLAVKSSLRGVETLALWAGLPHYINVSPNPRGALALLQSAAPLIDVKLDLAPLAASARECEQSMSQMVSSDPELAEYVRELKRREFAQ